MGLSNNLFGTIPKHDYLHLSSDLKKVPEFLDYDANDVSIATNVPKSSVRYDEKMPKELKQRLKEIAIVCEMVAEFFDGDAQKTALWFTVRNPALGNISPRDMIRFGQFEKLQAFILSALEGHTP